MANYRDFSVQKSVAPGSTATGITTNATTHDECRAIYVGTDDSYDFYINGSWVKFKNANEGSILPVRATGARISSGSTAPSTGDIVFLY